MGKIISYSYFKIPDKYHEYKGHRFFRVNMYSDEVVQVCLSTGDMKRGRGNLFGVYMISKPTFFMNYLCFGYSVPCEKKEYDKAFKKVLEGLS